MKKYQLYGIGNALVDEEYSISEALLEQINVKKGTMTLISKDELDVLLSEIGSLKPYQEGGGSAANTLMTLARLGVKTFYSCRVADDALGDFYHQDLENAGVITNQYHCHRPAGQTGQCVVLLTPDAERTMCTYLGITADFSPAEVVESELIQSEYLYIEGYLIASPSAKKAMHLAKATAKQHGIKTVLSLSDPNIVNYFHNDLLELIGQHEIDLLFCNHHEAMSFCQVDSIEQAANALKELVHQFAITVGGQGALLYDGEKLIKVPAYPVKVIDTLGAGDAYAAGFLYALTHGYDFVAAGKVANRIAAQVVTKLGARISLEEAQTLKNQLARVQEDIPHFERLEDIVFA